VFPSHLIHHKQQHSRLMLRDVTTSMGVSMNSYHGSLTAWKPMMVCVINIYINWLVFRTPCDQSSPTGNAHPHSSASALLARLASLFHRFRLGPDNAEADELPQPPTLPALHPRVLFTRLSSLIRRNSPPDDTPNEELQQPSTPLRLDLHVLLTRLSLLLPRSRLNTDGETEAHHTTPSGSRPDAIVDRLSSIFRSRPHTNENVELSQRATRLHVVDVAPMRDREVCISSVSVSGV
jgi:hypothetical protein